MLLYDIFEQIQPDSITSIYNILKELVSNIRNIFYISCILSQCPDTLRSLKGFLICINQHALWQCQELEIFCQ